MLTWRPLRIDEVAAIVERDLADCDATARAFFAARRVQPRQVAIERYSQSEFVVVVAEGGGVALYYEDVEEGWNLSPLGPDGSIVEPGFDQDDLRIALCKWQMRAVA